MGGALALARVARARDADAMHRDVDGARGAARAERFFAHLSAGDALLYAPGTGFGAPRLARLGREVARVDTLSDDPVSASRAVRRFLDSVDAARSEATVCALLSYEASVALDPRAPRRVVDRALGPLALAHVLLDDDDEDAAHAVARDGSLALDRAPIALSPTRGARAHHRREVAACIEAIHDGTLYQANLAHALAVTSRGADHVDESALARLFVDKTRTRPPLFAAYLRTPDVTLASLSPECFLSFDLARRTVSARPIKGTRPRGASPDDDARLLDELRTSEKDRAEHVMIVDLLRNDLSRVCRAGTVSVTSLMHAISAANVHHLESTIVGTLDEDVSLADLFGACAPGGSITGAPKSTAIERIHASETRARGPYTGNLFVVDRDGRGEASILIRTIVRAPSGEAVLHVGGGIVADSDPDEEWRETLAKARAFGEVDDVA